MQLQREALQLIIITTLKGRLVLIKEILRFTTGVVLVVKELLVKVKLSVYFALDGQFFTVLNVKHSIDHKQKNYITRHSNKMANTSSAKKKTKVIKSKTAINRIRQGKYKNVISDIEDAINSGDKAKAVKLFDNFQSKLMKVSKKGSIRRQTVSRKISRTAKKIALIK